MACRPAPSPHTDAPLSACAPTESAWRTSTFCMALPPWGSGRQRLLGWRRRRPDWHQRPAASAGAAAGGTDCVCQRFCGPPSCHAHAVAQSTWQAGANCKSSCMPTVRQPEAGCNPPLPRRRRSARIMRGQVRDSIALRRKPFRTSTVQSWQHAAAFCEQGHQGGRFFCTAAGLPRQNSTAGCTCHLGSCSSCLRRRQNTGWLFRWNCFDVAAAAAAAAPTCPVCFTASAVGKALYLLPACPCRWC